jgi:AcrR family transcriptional regulator
MASKRKSASIEARQATRRDAVLDEAMRLVERGGLDGLSAVTLAKALGVVPAALYRTFASMDAVKGALVARALDRLDDDLRAAVGELREATRKRALRRVVAAANVLPALRSRDPARHRLVDLALSAPTPLFDDETALAVEARLQRVLFHVARALDDAVAAGALSSGDAELRTLALLAVVHGADHFVKRDRLAPARLHAAQVHREALRALLAGWGAEPRVLAAVL